MKNWSKALKNISMLTQLGLSLMMPLLLCLGGCYALTNYAHVGFWVYIPGFILGLGSSFTTAYKFYQMVMKDETKNDRADSVSFNTHR